MRIAILLMFALAGCAGTAPVEAAEPDSGPDTEPEAAGPEASEEAEPEAAQEAAELVVLAEVECPLDELAASASGSGVRGVTSTHCAFEDIEVPEAASHFDVTFTWDADWTYDGLGIRVSDQTQCDVDGGCSIGEDDGASPVVLKLSAEGLEGHGIKGLDVCPFGFPVQPSWDVQVTFYGWG